MLDTYYFYNHHGISTVADLAQSGRWDHREFLARKRQVPDIIYGLALGGLKPLVEELLEQYPQYKSYAVMGYARAGDLSQANLLAGQDLELLKAKVQGHAQALNTEQVNGALKTHRGREFLLPAILGFAVNPDATEELCNLLKSTRYHSDALLVAACAGATKNVNGICELLELSIEEIPSLERADGKLLCFNQILYGFGMGRHYAEAAKLINAGMSADFCLTGFEANTEYSESYDVSADLAFLKSFVESSKHDHIHLCCEAHGLAINPGQQVPEDVSWENIKDMVLANPQAENK